MKEDYEPVFLPNESITTKKHKVGDIVKMKVLEVMDDGVKAMCSHSQKKPVNGDGMKEMAESTTTRYKSAMAGEMES